MSTTAEHFWQADEIFRAASKLDPAVREPYVIERCGGNVRLLLEIQALLQADQLPQGVLDRPALGNTSEMNAVEAAMLSSRPMPERIGRYRIVRVIGEGGMGIVYEAEQDEPRRRVALKVIRAGMMSAGLLRRFRHEAQMLGQLRHPGIAQIYEAGTADQGQGGQPFFAMELISGRPLLEFADAQHLNTRQRLELVIRLCEAVHHAHLNGVIHRDLKPANILVQDHHAQLAGTSLSDSDRGEAQPKILDFGIARATEADVHTVSLNTSVGQLVGTVAYMSPEQAAGDPALLDIRSDVYALGVIAYELLAGRLPYAVNGKLIHEAVRVIREDEPSRLSSINRVFRGDIETIIAKALEKDKQRRYQSAADFAADIRRHLSEQPIAARPASRLYQLRKFARRNKAVVGAVAAAFVALSIATAASVRQAIVAKRAHHEERRLRGIADERTAEAQRQLYRASLVAASSALRFHEIPDAKRQLDAAPEALRGWEWQHLYSRLDESSNSLDLGFAPMCLAISPDGRTIASGSSAGRIGLWRIPELTLIASHSIKGDFNERRIARLLFSADGRELRADAVKGAVRLNATTLEPISRDVIAAHARSIDGRVGIAIVDQESDLVSAIELDGKRELFQFTYRDAFNSVMSFAPDGEQVAMCLRDDGGLIKRRTSDGTIAWRRPDLNSLTRIAFSADGSRMALASMSGAAQIISARSGEDLLTLRGHAVSVTAIAFSPDESIIATASSDRTVRLWRASDGALLAVMHGNQANVSDMVFAPDGNTVITAAADRMLRWWDATVTHDPFVLPASGTVYGLAFSPDGKQIVGASLVGENPLRIWDAHNGKEMFAGSDGNLSALAISSDGEHLAVGRSGSAPSTVYTREGSEVSAVAGSWWRTNWLAFRNNGKELLSLSNGGRLIATELATAKQIQIKGFPAETNGEGCRAAINPDESLIAVASRSTIHLLDLKSWNELGTMQAENGTIYALAFSPDGSRLLSGSSNGSLRVWDVERREVIATLQGHSGDIFAALFSRDGKRIFSAGRDRVIRVWDVECFELITQLYGHTSLIYCLALSPDGATLASGGGDATVRIWGTKPYRDGM